MEPATLFITDPSKPQIIGVTNSITNSVKNSDNPIIVPQATNTIKETNNNFEPTPKTTTESSNTIPNEELTTDKDSEEIIEPSTTHTEKETNNSDANHVMKPIKDDSKKTTLIIVFSILGCVVVIGGVIGLVIYFKKRSLNVINNTNNVNSTNKDNSGIVSLNKY